MITRCCGRCGRWGSRGFIETDRSDRDGAWVCRNDRACEKRALRPARNTPRPENCDICGKFMKKLTIYDWRCRDVWYDYADGVWEHD